MLAGTTLVTGATGFAGSHLLDKLADCAPLIAWHRPKGHPPDPNRHLDWRSVDLLDAAEVAHAVADSAPSQIFHLAGAPQVASSFRSAIEHLQTNVMGTHNLLEAVRKSGRPCRVLVVTSAQVYQASDEPIDESAPLVPASPYGLSKLGEDQLATRACEDDGLDVVIARPFNHAGPRQSAAYAVSSFARQIARIEAGLAPPELLVGNLETRRDMTDVRDVVEAYELMMQHAPAGRPFNICSGRAWRIGDLLDELLHLARVPITVRLDADRLRPSDTPVLQGDATRIRSELGWTPRIRVEQMLSDTLEWWRQQTTNNLQPTTNN
ncbi:MAG TPA: GDP-mannose 4,6-dehydratase [Vicinamibacterales bacterium]|nr:GDP-mannose 4,6-dehydratase [Vicinamibacterales bacterium]